MKYPKPVWPYSPYVKVWDFLYCSGQIWLNPETMKLIDWWVSTQTEQVIKNIIWVLSENNLELENIFKTTIYLKDINDFSVINDIYWQYFNHKPARTTIEVSNLPLNALIEIEVIANFWAK